MGVRACLKHVFVGVGRTRFARELTGSKGPGWEMMQRSTIDRRKPDQKGKIRAFIVSYARLLEVEGGAAVQSV